MPSVSIIIPTHDRGELLMQTLASVQAQTFADFDAIVVDDHSTDDTLARLAPIEAADARIRHIALPEGQSGAQAARNAGIAAATGEYLILLDSDDLLAPHCLERRVTHMQAHPDLDAVVFGCEVFRKTPGDVHTRWNVFTDENDIDRLLKWDVPWQTTSPIWRTESIRRVGEWDESVGVAQDWYFHLTALCRGIKYEMVADIDHYWRRPDGERDSIGTQAVRPPLIRSRAETMFKALDLLRKTDQLTDARKRFMTGLIFVAAERVAEKVNRKEALALWQRAIAEQIVPADIALAGSSYFRFFRFERTRASSRKRIVHLFGDLHLGRSRTSLVCPVGDVPTISCVVPAYNAERYLRSAIDSILKQTWGDFELIVVDDGSTDSTLEILREYERRDARVRPISRPNTGHTGAINDGIAAARGEFIARMDADDLALPERFAKQIAFLRANPDVVVVGGSVELIDPHDIPIGESRQPTTHEEIDAKLMHGSGGVIPHPLATFRKSAYDRVGPYRAKFNGSEDLDLWLRFAEIGKVANLPEILLKYRRHYQAFSFAKNQVQMQHKAHILGEAAERRGLPKPQLDMDKYWKPPPVDEQILKWGWRAIKVGRIDAARAYAKSLLKMKPLSVDSWRLFYSAMRGH
jgi:glycosyltransferase involved in cell wall biosynthesis